MRRRFYFWNEKAWFLKLGKGSTFEGRRRLKLWSEETAQLLKRGECSTSEVRRRLLFFLQRREVSTFEVRRRLNFEVRRRLFLKRTDGSIFEWAEGLTFEVKKMLYFWCKIALDTNRYKWRHNCAISYIVKIVDSQFTVFSVLPGHTAAGGGSIPLSCWSLLRSQTLW